MKKYKIMLRTIDDIKVFAAAAAGCDAELDLSSGRYVVDAKSIMGIFSLDLSKPITLSAPEDFSDEAFISKIQNLIVTE
jgi:phosphotransferase system HPr-like phosphotransfer protein